MDEQKEVKVTVKSSSSWIEAIAKELDISPSKVVRALDRIIAENEKRYFNSLRMRKL